MASWTPARSISIVALRISYGEDAIPPDLRRAHQENDQAVMSAYGFTRSTPEYSSEAACVAALMRLYQEQTQEV